MTIRSRAVLIAAALLGTALAGCSGGPTQRTAADTAEQVTSPATRSPAPADSRPPAVRSYRSARQFAAVAPPVRVRIPSIGVRSPLERLGRAADGTVEVPRRWDRAGWY